MTISNSNNQAHSLCDVTQQNIVSTADSLKSFNWAKKGTLQNYNHETSYSFASNPGRITCLDSAHSCCLPALVIVGVK